MGDYENGYEKRSNEKKNAILNAARQLFCQRGVTRVSVGEIAALAKVSQVSIYNYFNDKSTLARLVLDGLVQEAMASIEETITGQAAFPDKLAMIMNVKLQLIAAFSGGSWAGLAQGDRAFGILLEEAIAGRADRLISAFVDAGIDSGDLRDGIPKEAYIRYLSASLGILQDPAYADSSDECKRGVMDLVLHGLFGGHGGQGELGGHE